MGKAKLFLGDNWTAVDTGTLPNTKIYSLGLKNENDLFAPYQYGIKLKSVVKKELKPVEDKESNHTFGFTF